MTIQQSWLVLLHEDLAHYVKTKLVPPVFSPPPDPLYDADVLVKSCWVPEVEREKISGVELHVFPLSRSWERASRGCVMRRATFGLGLVSPMPQGSQESMAQAAQFMGDQLEKLLSPGVLIGGFSVVGVEQPQVIDAERWRTDQLASAFFTVSLEGYAT